MHTLLSLHCWVRAICATQLTDFKIIYARNVARSHRTKFLFDYTANQGTNIKGQIYGFLAMQGFKVTYMLQYMYCIPSK